MIADRELPYRKARYLVLAADPSLAKKNPHNSTPDCTSDSSNGATDNVYATFSERQDPVKGSCRS